MTRSRIRRSLSIFCILLTPLLGSAQDPASGANSSSSSSPVASIAGTVIQEHGSRPLKKVVVQIMAEDQKRGGNYTASTDSDGHFHVEGVVPGRYRIFFEKTGMVEVNGRGLKADVNVFTLRAGQALDDLLFRMLPTAVITGRVTDEDRDPMSGVRVLAQRKKPGKAGARSCWDGATNDLGEYRLSGMFPGTILIVAIPPPISATRTEPRKKSARGRSRSRFRAISRLLSEHFRCHAGFADHSQGGRRDTGELHAGPVAAYRIRGVITGVSTKQKPVVEVMSKAGTRSEPMRAKSVLTDSSKSAASVPDLRVAGERG